MIHQGWQEQYDRMRRSYAHFVGMANGSVDSGGSDRARDALFHFFQDAYHLKDWLKNDPGLSFDRNRVEVAVNGSEPLKLCADLCNRTKHFTLDRRSRTGDGSTAFVSQAVTVHAPAGRLRMGPGGEAESSEEDDQQEGGRGFVAHAWTVRSNGQDFDAETLAGEVVAEWDRLLRSAGLL